MRKKIIDLKCVAGKIIKGGEGGKSKAIQLYTPLLVIEEAVDSCYRSTVIIIHRNGKKIKFTNKTSHESFLYEFFFAQEGF